MCVCVLCMCVVCVFIFFICINTCMTYMYEYLRKFTKKLSTQFNILLKKKRDFYEINLMQKINKLKEI